MSGTAAAAAAGGLGGGAVGGPASGSYLLSSILACALRLHIHTYSSREIHRNYDST